MSEPALGSDLPGWPTSVTIVALHTCRATVSVSGPDGRVASGARVRAVVGGTGDTEVVTDENGSAQLRVLPGYVGLVATCGSGEVGKSGLLFASDGEDVSAKIRCETHLQRTALRVRSQNGRQVDAGPTECIIEHVWGMGHDATRAFIDGPPIELAGLRGESLLLLVRSPGHQEVEYRWDAMTAAVPASVTIVYLPECAIRLSVTDRDGVAVAHHAISLEQLVDGLPAGARHVPLTASTDRQGNLHAVVPAAGRYTVRAAGTQASMTLTVDPAAPESIGVLRLDDHAAISGAITGVAPETLRDLKGLSVRLDGDATGSRTPRASVQPDSLTWHGLTTARPGEVVTAILESRTLGALGQALGSPGSTFAPIHAKLPPVQELHVSLAGRRRLRATLVLESVGSSNSPQKVRITLSRQDAGVVRIPLPPGRYRAQLYSLATPPTGLSREPLAFDVADESGRTTLQFP